MVYTKTVLIVALIFVFASSLILPVYAQTGSMSDNYRLRKDDRLTISVPQRPDLTQQVVVGSNGTIEIPLVGVVAVEGQTVKDVRANLLQALREYYPSITSVRLAVRSTSDFTVYIIGAVGSPGKYAFDEAPNLWEAIREAGGAEGEASTDIVRVVKDTSKGGSSKVINVQRALETGTVDKLPMLEDGDTVIIPKKEEVYSGDFGVNVLGSVLKPGQYRLQGSNQSLVSALLLAGGALPEAALSKIQIVRPSGDGSMTTMDVDFNRFLKGGDPTANPTLKPGDTVNVNSQNRFLYAFKNDPNVFLAIIATSLSIVLIFDNLNNP